MTLTLTPAQFAALLIAVPKQPGANLIQLSSTTGTVTVHGVTLAYSFDGSQLTGSIKSKQGLAVFDSDANLESLAMKWLNQFTQGETGP